MRFQSTPAKKGCALISPAPLTPRRSLLSAIRRFIRSAEEGDRFASWGSWKVFFQCKIFWQVTEGSSEKNLLVKSEELRGVAHQHFEQDYADAPPVDGFGVALLGEDFGGDVVGGADG